MNRVDRRFIEIGQRIRQPFDRGAMIRIFWQDFTDQIVVRLSGLEAGQRIAQQNADPAPQFRRGQLSEGRDQDLIDRQVRSLQEEAEDETGDSKCLPGAGAGFNQKRAAADLGFEEGKIFHVSFVMTLRAGSKIAIAISEIPARADRARCRKARSK